MADEKLIQPSDLGKSRPSDNIKDKTIADIEKEGVKNNHSSDPEKEKEKKNIEVKESEKNPENTQENKEETKPDQKDKGLKKEDQKDKKPKKKKPKKKGGALFLHVSLQDKMLFTRHMSIGIKAGMSLIAALELIRDQTKSKSLKLIINQLIDDVNGGMFLSESLSRYKNIFGSLFINIIKIGESSGTLAENLNYLTKELKKKHDLHSKVRGALIYPTVVLVATLGIAGSMIIFIFPKILPVFASLKVKLTFTTRALITISNALTQHGLVIGGIIVVAIIGFVFLIKVKQVKHVIHHILLYLPVIKKMIIQVNIANFSRTFGLLLKSGVNITEAISITADTTTNLVYRHELKAAAAVLLKGEFLSSYLAKDPKLFPPIAVNMMKVGENTGNLTENLNYLSEYYEEQVGDFVKNLSSIIEPALMIVMGVIVGFIALSIITPIYSLTKGLQQ